MELVEHWIESALVATRRERYVVLSEKVAGICVDGAAIVCKKERSKSPARATANSGGAVKLTATRVLFTKTDIFAWSKMSYFWILLFFIGKTVGSFLHIWIVLNNTTCWQLSKMWFKWSRLKCRRFFHNLNLCEPEVIRTVLYALVYLIITAKFHSSLLLLHSLQEMKIKVTISSIKLQCEL